ncbi:MAG: STAS/SEC14 domain-containing protein [Alcanivoracaceae bacterium]|nr:STAS/SEC14 domain-containing protein [Alcanivoracaceae bacterium]MCG8438804.1 STAS/SEC14 domain-containing protein [Pseudomonadales bacterium]MED5431260.1 STAS/SEC14 domain-containing protein [Pseudomonadota bacterium]|tara:strand:+ start:4960 stop:5322 length:363 start_codon:yes stop_codon:yes gene_type:complete
MLTLIPFDDSRVVGARISGKITRPEFETVAAALEAALEKHDKVRFYAEMETFGGVAMDALFEDLKFGLRHWKQFEREAVVTESDWLRRLGVLADKLLPGIDVQVFPRDQQDAAKHWICEG